MGNQSKIHKVSNNPLQIFNLLQMLGTLKVEFSEFFISFLKIAENYQITGALALEREKTLFNENFLHYYTTF